MVRCSTSPWWDSIAWTTSGAPRRRAQLGADQGVRPLDLVRDRLADVVHEGAPLDELDVDAELGGDRAADVRGLHQVPQDVLPVARSGTGAGRAA